MNIIPTLEGGLRIDTETAADWALLRHLVHDAADRPRSLGEQLGEGVGDEQATDDWREFVVPGLDQQFSESLAHVGQAVAIAEREHGGGTGPLWITREDGLHWFSALNQARLSIEERFRFGARPEDAAGLSADDLRRSAYLRSQLYCAIQSLLLEHVLQ